MNIAFIGGGTFGHIAPALPVIENLKKDKIIFITPMNSKKYFTNITNIKVYYIESYGIIKKELFNVKRYLINVKAIKKIKAIFKEEKIDVVVGMGGYLSCLGTFAANKSKQRIILQEQNSVIGLAQKISFKKCDVLLASFPLIDWKYSNSKKVKLIGNPRFDTAKKNSLSIKKEDIILVTSGSLGAQVINDTIIDFINNGYFTNYKFIIVTGTRYYLETVKKIKNQSNVSIYPYFNNLPNLFRKAKIVITRAGSSSLFEAVGSYTIPVMIPSPNVTANHQYHNAHYFEKLKMGVLIEEKNLTTNSLRDGINLILNEYDLYIDAIKDFHNLPSATNLFIKEINHGSI